MISRFSAPIDRLIPISLVRSDTETSMIFMIPMPHTMREIAAIPHRNALSVQVTFWIVESVSAELFTVKFALFGSDILNFARK